MTKDEIIQVTVKPVADAGWLERAQTGKLEKGCWNESFLPFLPPCPRHGYGIPQLICVVRSKGVLTALFVTFTYLTKN
ncbi:hypothetical protein SAMN05192534_102140 [Alteribacillus persepolensis]|uniref:Uncharacterized protein n=1 Tax=Alteribacillus persepolensis TaxID=568899 RepID=A0A1G8AFV1_9BACI|nr:hypothetical protein SAMN05192534_102140 [Alteribacillus persepolensis]